MAKSWLGNLLMLAVSMPLAACAANPPVKAGVAPEARVGMAPPTRIPAIAPAAPAGEPIAIASVPRDVRRAVVADAAKRFKVASSAVVLANAEKVNWNDGALGCPEPGHMYTQMIVAGFRVMAKTREGNLTYHTDANGNVRSCLDSSPLPMMDTEPQPYPPKPAAPEK